MRFANTRVENWYVPAGSCAIENSPCVETVVLYTARVARFTACTGSPRAGTPSGSRIFPVSEPVPGCCADNAAAETTAIRRNDRMDALYNPSAAHTLVRQGARLAAVVRQESQRQDHEG